MMNNSYGRMVAQDHRRVTMALNKLIGIISGIVCDEHLADVEIHYLNNWLKENEQISTEYPVNIIKRRLYEILLDNIITQEERDHLLNEFKTISGNYFMNTGSAMPEFISDIFENDPLVIFQENRFVFTGNFLYGTRGQCHRATERRGGIIANSVTRTTNYPIVGSRASPDWITENFGTKIQKAAEMYHSGDYEISIIREADWVMALR